MPKNKSCGYSVTHVTCGTIKFVLEHLGHLYYALQRMTFSGTASLVLRWTLCEVVKDISFPTCQLLSPDSVRKSYPRGGKLTFSRCLGVGNLPLAYIKMSNSPGSARAPTLGLNIDRCISWGLLFSALWYQGKHFAIPLPTWMEEGRRQMFQVWMAMLRYNPVQ